MKTAIFIFCLMVGVVRGQDLSTHLTNPIKIQKSANIRTLKASSEWVNLNTQLDQYDAHYVNYTNALQTADSKIALVTDAKTQTALEKLSTAINKQQQLVDDLHDAVVKIKKILVDVTNNQ